MCKWLRREGRQQRVGLLAMQSLIGCCGLQGGHISSYLAKWGVNHGQRSAVILLLVASLNDSIISVIGVLDICNMALKKHMWCKFVALSSLLYHLMVCWLYLPDAVVSLNTLHESDNKNLSFLVYQFELRSCLHCLAMVALSCKWAGRPAGKQL